MKRLKYICDENGTKIEENALRMIANLADGAMRDAISILERCTGEQKEDFIISNVWMASNHSSTTFVYNFRFGSN